MVRHLIANQVYEGSNPSGDSKNSFLYITAPLCYSLRMKAYKVELLIVDHDELGPDEIVVTLENTKYPNWCIDPIVLTTEEADIGDWEDTHPLNYSTGLRSNTEKFFKDAKKVNYRD